jgi:hypothetical protein
VEAVTSAGIGLWALVALAQTGAAVSVPVRVEFDAPAGCSDAEAFFAGVLARTRHVHRARPGETPVRLTVRVTRAGAKVRGELRVNEAGAEAETRRVDGASCAEVVQVLSLTAALAIDPTASLLGPAAPERSPAAGSPVRAPAPPATPSAGRAPAGAATASGPAPASAPPGSASAAAPAGGAAAQSTPPGSAPAEKPPAAATALTPQPPTVALEAGPTAVVAEPRREPAPASAPRFGASVVAARVLTSSMALGGSFWGRLGIATHGALTPSVTLGALYLPGNFFESGDDLGIGWMALAASACPGWAPGLRVRIEPCARITAGVLSVTDHSVNTPRSVLRWWGSAGVLVRLSAPVGAGLMLDLDAGVDFPFVTRRFITTTVTNQPVGATSSVSPTLSVGLSHSL